MLRLIVRSFAGCSPTRTGFIVATDLKLNLLPRRRQKRA
jgi:hypothetical protein